MLERFSKSAREAVVGARREAEAAGLHFVGSEHLLLAMVAPDAGPSYEVLHAAGLTADHVRAEIARLAGPAAGGLSAEDAAALRSIGIDLAAVVASVEGTFGPGALDQPADPEPVRGFLGRRLRGGADQRGALRGPRFTGRAKKVLELAVRESVHRKDGFIGTEHLLLGLIREGGGIAVQVITGAGIAPADLRAALDARRDKAA